MTSMRIDVLTTFPELFEGRAPGVLGVSMPARAIAAGVLRVVATDIRAYTKDRHERTDDRPFGGGPGMVMTCQPVWDAVGAVEAMDARRAHRVLMSPQGARLDQAMVERLAGCERLLVIAGHYEGIDERVVEALGCEEVSIGDYVLSGGELAALVLIDAVARLLPGALGHGSSASQDSFCRVPTTNPDGGAINPKHVRRWLEELGLGHADVGMLRLLDCPHYTRPREWMGRAVPEELLSGDHEAVARWRLAQMVRRTRARRPDLLGDSTGGMDAPDGAGR